MTVRTILTIAGRRLLGSMVTEPADFFTKLNTYVEKCLGDTSNISFNSPRKKRDLISKSQRVLDLSNKYEKHIYPKLVKTNFKPPFPRKYKFATPSTSPPTRHAKIYPCLIISHILFHFALPRHNPTYEYVLLLLARLHYKPPKFAFRQFS